MRTIRLALLCLLMVGCSSPPPTRVVSGPSTPYPTQIPALGTLPAEVAASTPPPASPAPAAPTATLTTATGTSQVAWVGSYCLDGTCTSKDESGIVVPPEALVVAPREAITFTLDNGIPQLATMRVLAWTPTGAASPDGGTITALDAELLASGDLEPTAAPTWEAPPMAGEYVLDMNTVYEDGDTLAYTWHIIVR